MSSAFTIFPQPPLIFLFLAIGSALSGLDQKFVYNANDNVIVQANSSLHLSMLLTTTSDQYLSESTLAATLSIVSSSTIPYNILYFNYQSQAGQQCYQNWILTDQIPNKSNCSDLISASFQELIDLPVCCRYIGCSSQNVNLTIDLSQELYRHSYLLIQNDNLNDIVSLQTTIKLELSSDNSWFYWGVGLTCLLLISLVIFTGIVFYWMLKYKRVKKMFQQFKLTEESISKQD